MITYNLSINVPPNTRFIDSEQFCKSQEPFLSTKCWEQPRLLQQAPMGAVTAEKTHFFRPDHAKNSWLLASATRKDLAFALLFFFCLKLHQVGNGPIFFHLLSCDSSHPSWPSLNKNLPWCPIKLVPIVSTPPFHFPMCSPKKPLLAAFLVHHH